MSERDQTCCAGLLLQHFKRGWLIELHAVPPSPDMARSALQPIFVRAEKMVPGQKPSRTNVCSIARNPTGPNAEHLDEICQASNTGNCSCFQLQVFNGAPYIERRHVSSEFTARPDRWGCKAVRALLIPHICFKECQIFKVTSVISYGRHSLCVSACLLKI